MEDEQVQGEGVAVDDAQGDAAATHDTQTGITVDELRGVLAGTLSENNETLARSLVGALAESDGIEGETQQALTLDADQWGYLRQTLQVQNTSLVFGLLLLAAILGALCVQYFVGGANRG